MNNDKGHPPIQFRIPKSTYDKMLEDLQRPHPYAYERVGFLFTKSKYISDGRVLIIATSYQPVDDDDYLNDKTVGAKIGSTAIRKAMQFIRENKVGAFHVHLHDHLGKPFPSLVDESGIPGVIESFSNISADQPNGFIILSEDNFYSSIFLPSEKEPRPADLISVVGSPIQFYFNEEKHGQENYVFDRQSFLGINSQFLLENVKVAIVGYGGGGSHVGQQLAHLGVKNTLVFDADHIEDSNLNRLIGGRWKDVKIKLSKTAIATRVFNDILPQPHMHGVNKRWQEIPEELQWCSIAIGTVDTYSERQQLEAECRRYLIPYIDIGMDVHPAEKECYSISGQVILSLPGGACFWCYGFLTEEKLSKEAAKYGEIGGRPQVVWPNGVLASTAVGILVDLITGWTRKRDPKIYLEYDGNSGFIKDHVRIRFCDQNCSHFPLEQCGPVNYVQL